LKAPGSTSRAPSYAAESRWAGAELGPHEHEALISPVLGHAEVARQATLRDQVELVLFTSRML